MIILLVLKNVLKYFLSNFYWNILKIFIKLIVINWDLINKYNIDIIWLNLLLQPNANFLNYFLLSFN
jgi:hypothetical protein